MITYAKQGKIPLISEGLFVPKMPRVLPVLVGKSTTCSHLMSLKVSKKSWLMETGQLCPEKVSGRCISTNPEDVVPESCGQVIYGCTRLLHY